MGLTPLPPLDLPWKPKPLGSARIERITLGQSRIRYQIAHDLLRGVTPAMLVWWFNNLEGETELDGAQIPRYRVWHPRDHVRVHYRRPARDGSRGGPGAELHIQEVFGRCPEYAMDVVARVERLDEGGFSHVEHVRGVPAGRMDIRFEAVEGGTLYESMLTVGVEIPVVGAILNRLIRPRMFPDDKGDAWVRHNVEEVGNLENFLPELWENQRDTPKHPVGAFGHATQQPAT